MIRGESKIQLFIKKRSVGQVLINICNVVHKHCLTLRPDRGGGVTPPGINVIFITTLSHGKKLGKKICG